MTVFEAVVLALLVGATVATTPVRTSSSALAMIASHEGFSARAYTDYGQCSIGFGHGLHAGPCTGTEPDVTRGQALIWFASDVRKAERCVLRHARVGLTQGQFDALTGFTYNVGCGGLAGSRLLVRLNAGDTDGARAEFGNWVHAGGRVLPGLRNRRADEARVFGVTHETSANKDRVKHQPKCARCAGIDG